MAADRDNPKGSHLCQPLAPPVLITLKRVIEACNRSNTPVTLCGEMAGKPGAFLLLLGMGLRRFSMSPAFVPSIKQLTRQVSIKQAEQILETAMKFKTTAKVKHYMAETVGELAPDLQLLSSR
jgi:phosphotransferase system enzyme I (PtsI)